MDIKYDQRLISLAKEVASLAPKSCMVDIMVSGRGLTYLRVCKFDDVETSDWDYSDTTEDVINGVYVTLTHYKPKKEDAKNE
jgi:hypothetical protein